MTQNSQKSGKETPSKASCDRGLTQIAAKIK